MGSRPFFPAARKHNYSSEAVTHLRKRRVNCKEQTERKQQAAPGAPEHLQEKALSETRRQMSICAYQGRSSGEEEGI